MIPLTDAQLVALCKAAGFHPEAGITKLSGGMWSAAYRIASDDRDYVIRINGDNKDFEKEKVIIRLLQHNGVPVPRLVATGKGEDLYYAVSERCAGYTMIDENTTDAVVFALFECLLQLQDVEVAHLNGWGFIDEDGQGIYNSWAEALLSFHNSKMDYTIEGLIKKGLIQKEIVTRSTDKIQSLLPFCKTEKQLVHGDFGFDNALTDGKKITGIIDWAEARLGDFLYDVAYLIFNSTTVNYEKLWRQFVQTQCLQLKYMQERLLCYQLVIGLNNIAIAAHLGKKKEYREDLEKLQRLL